MLECEEECWNAGFQRMELVATLSGEPLYSALGYTKTDRTEMRTRDGKSLSAFRMEKFLGKEPRRSTQERPIAVEVK